MNSFENAVAELNASSKELWLGSLLMFSVEETLINHTDLVKVLHASGLTAYIPRVPEDSDIFRRVSTAAQRKKVPTTDPDVFENYMIREVPSKDGVLKRIVRETVDAKDKVLAYEPNLCSLQFRRTSGKIEIVCPTQDVNIASIAEQISNSFTAQRGCLNAMALRDLIRRILNSVNATNVRGKGGGVYFVSRDHFDKVDALELMASNLPHTVRIMVIPFLDDEKRREYVRESYEMECTADIKDLLDEISEYNMGAKKVSGDKFAGYLSRFQDFGPKVKEYEDLLQTQLGSLHSLLKITRASLMNLSAFSLD